MTKFSEHYQPEKRGGPRLTCRNGHTMSEGSPNIRTRADGRRVCRECESNRRKNSYRQDKTAKAGVTLPFTSENLYYDLEVYKHTSTDVLSKFYGYQKDVLDRAKQKPKGVWTSPRGSRVEAEAVIETLEREIPILYQHILSRATS